MLCGRPPFCADSHMDIYHAIMRGRYQTPPDCPRQARDLISQLLAQSHATRLGSGRGGHREASHRGQPVVGEERRSSSPCSGPVGALAQLFRRHRFRGFGGTGPSGALGARDYWQHRHLPVRQRQLQHRRRQDLGWPYRSEARRGLAARVRRLGVLLISVPLAEHVPLWPPMHLAPLRNISVPLGARLARILGHRPQLHRFRRARLASTGHSTVSVPPALCVSCVLAARCPLRYMRKIKNKHRPVTRGPVSVSPAREPKQLEILWCAGARWAMDDQS